MKLDAGQFLFISSMLIAILAVVIWIANHMK
jgi:hypothetical protein